MGAAENKQRMQQVFNELAQGNGQPLFEIMRDDVEWTVSGTTSWSKTYMGKQALRDELFMPVRAVLTARAQERALRIIADDEYVVVEGRGDNLTTRGERYDNHYCHVFRFLEGRVQSVTEYLDTELTERVLGPRAEACASAAARGRPISSRSA